MRAAHLSRFGWRFFVRFNNFLSPSCHFPRGSNLQLIALNQDRILLSFLNLVKDQFQEIPANIMIANLISSAEPSGHSFWTNFRNTSLTSRFEWSFFRPCFHAKKSSSLVIAPIFDTLAVYTEVVVRTESKSLFKAQVMRSSNYIDENVSELLHGAPCRRHVTSAGEMCSYGYSR